MFDEVFPQVVATGARRFTDYADEDFDTLEQALIKLKQLETLAIDTATQRLESPELEQRMKTALAATSGS